jgi:hypothetical protein
MGKLTKGQEVVNSAWLQRCLEGGRLKIYLRNKLALLRMQANYFSGGVAL